MAREGPVDSSRMRTVQLLILHGRCPRRQGGIAHDLAARPRACMPRAGGRGERSPGGVAGPQRERAPRPLVRARMPV